MLEIILLIACAAMLAIYAFSRPGFARTGPYLPDFTVFGVATYVLGAATLHFEGSLYWADEVLVLSAIALIALCAGFVLGAVLFERRYPQSYTQERLGEYRLARGEEFFIYLGLIACGLVCAAFSVQVLGNTGIAALLPSFTDFESAASGDLLQARKAITNATEGYFAPGFVKQFRDILAPVLLAAVALIAVRKRIAGAKLVIAAGAALAIFVAMLLTGVRSNIFLLFVTLFLAFWCIQRVRQPIGSGRGKKRGRRRKISSRNSIIFIVLALFAYGALTILLGRVDADNPAISLVFNLASNLFDRIVLTVPRENILSFGFWSNLQGSTGEYWLADLGGVLPGNQGTTLSNLLHSYLGGSMQGNSVLGMPADVWVNWGWVGLVVFPLSYALMINAFDCQLSRMRSPLAFGVKVTLAVALVKIYSPFGFLLYGGAIALIVFLGAMLLHSRRKRRPNRYRYQAQAYPPIPQPPGYRMASQPLLEARG